MFYDARARPARPEAQDDPAGRAKHLLSLIATCGGCGAKLIVTYRLP